LRSKLFWKFYNAYLFIILLCLLISYFFLQSHFKKNLIQQTEIQLQQISLLVKQSIEHQALGRWNATELDPLIDYLSKDLLVRITLIDAQGRVVADSSLSGNDLLQLENHQLRPEILLAKEKGYGIASRYSTTLRTPMLYVATPFQEGVLRVALPLSGLQHSLNQLYRLLGLGLFLGALISAGVSLILARRFSQPLLHINEAALQMAQAKFQVRLPERSNDELSQLAQSMNQLSYKMGELVQKLSEEKQQLQVILDSMIEGVMVLNAEGKIVLTNPALCEFLSLTAPIVRSTPLELVRSPDLQEIVTEVLTGKNFIGREIEIYRGLDQRYLRVHASPLKAEGKFQGSVLVFYDLSQEKRLETIRRDFVANVSHELKTPLAAIQGYTETLLSGALKDEKVALSFLEKIEKNSVRLNSILQDLLDLSKIESGRYDLKLEQILLAPILEELRNVFEKTIREKELRFEIEGNQNLSLWCDAKALNHILSNLIDNAIKYSSSEGKIVLKISSEEEGVLFTIQDTGGGIAPEHLARIFERFYRVDASRSRQLGGTGLGLSIVKHLVLLQGGKIWVESEFGKGSCFYVLLPQTGII